MGNVVKGNPVSQVLLIDFSNVGNRKPHLRARDARTGEACQCPYLGTY